jgi:hypothetical protein
LHFLDLIIKCYKLLFLTVLSEVCNYSEYSAKDLILFGAPPPRSPPPPPQPCYLSPAVMWRHSLISSEIPIKQDLYQTILFQAISKDINCQNASLIIHSDKYGGKYLTISLS